MSKQIVSLDTRSFTDGNGKRVTVTVMYDSRKFDDWIAVMAINARDGCGKETSMGGAVTVCVIDDGVKPTR